MPRKPTKCQLLWSLFVVLSKICSAVSGCNTTLTLAGKSGKIPIPSNSRYCFWKIKMPKRSKLSLSFDFTLEDCEKCKCEYIEIWDTDWTKDPKHSIGRFCGDLKNEEILLRGVKYALVEYWSSKTSSSVSPRFLHYKRYKKDRPAHKEDDDHDDEGQHDHRHDRDHKGSAAITSTAIGILLSLVFLIGAIACGVCLVHFARPKARRRRRRQPSVQQTPVTSGLPKLPHLPNYFEDETAVPPPYLETIGADGNAVSPPSYYGNPPPYSILDTESSLETTGDTKASDLMNRKP